MKNFLILGLLVFASSLFAQSNKDSSGWVQNGSIFEQKLKIGAVTWCQYSKNGDTIFTMGKDDYFRKWDNKTGKLIYEINLYKFDSSHIAAFDYCEDLNLIATIFQKDLGKFTIYNLNLGSIRTSVSNYYTNYDRPQLFIDPSKNLLNIFSRDFNLGGASMSETGNISTFDLDTFKLTTFNNGYFYINLLKKSNINNSYVLRGTKRYQAIKPNYPVPNNENLSQLTNSTFGDFNIPYSDLYAIFPLQNHYISCASNKKITTFDYRNKILVNKNIQYDIADSLHYDIEVNFDNSIFTCLTGNYYSKNLTLFNISNGNFIKGYNIPEMITKITPSYTRNEAILSSTDSLLRKIDFSEIHEKINPNFFAGKDTARVDDSIYFYNISMKKGMSFNWEFGDGKSSTLENPIHNYSKSGKYDVRLIIFDGTEYDTTIKKNFITILESNINFEVSTYMGTPPLLVYFKDISGGTVLRKKWEFGDGDTSNEANPSHRYNKPGQYQAKLTLFSSNFEGTKIKDTLINVVEFIKDNNSSLDTAWSIKKDNSYFNLLTYSKNGDRILSAYNNNSALQADTLNGAIFKDINYNKSYSTMDFSSNLDQFIGFKDFVLDFNSIDSNWLTRQVRISDDALTEFTPGTVSTTRPFIKFNILNDTSIIFGYYYSIYWSSSQLKQTGYVNKSKFKVLTINQNQSFISKDYSNDIYQYLRDYCFSPNMSLIAVDSYKYDTGFQESITLFNHKDTILPYLNISKVGQFYFIKFTNDSKYVYGMNNERSLYRVGMKQTDTLEYQFRLDPKTSTFDFSRDDKQLITGSTDGKIRIIDLETGVTLDSAKVPYSITQIAVAPNNNSFATACIDGKIYLWKSKILIPKNIVIPIDSTTKLPKDSTSKDTTILDIEEVIIYPNPNIISQLNFTINLKEESNYKIISISGSDVLKGKVQSGKNTVELGNISSGTYILAIFSNSMKFLANKSFKVLR